MRVDDITDADGHLVAFEVPRLWLDHRGVCRVIQQIPGVLLLRRPRHLFPLLGPAQFCEFELGDGRFVARAKHGDRGLWLPGEGDRYWIGSVGGPDRRALATVRAAFADTHLPGWIGPARIAAAITMLGGWGFFVAAVLGEAGRRQKGASLALFAATLAHAEFLSFIRSGRLNRPLTLTNRVRVATVNDGLLITLHDGSGVFPFVFRPGREGWWAIPVAMVHSTGVPQGMVGHLSRSDHA